MPRTPTAIVGSTAAQIADLVRAGEASPTDVVRAHLEQIDRVNPRLNAFQVVRGDRAMAEAKALGRRRGILGDLPLAGVPVAIKDNVPVAGEPMRDGSPATTEAPRAEDHAVVARIRAAGGIVIGMTRVPELCIWGTTDGPWGITRNPWDPSRTPGGSSGGSGAAVGSAMVPVAHGNDGMGSIRIPSASCGLVGIKPGVGLIPWGDQASEWFEQAQHGSIATTVEDCARLLSVMADRPELARVKRARKGLRFAVSVKSPLTGVTVDAEWKGAARSTAELLAGAGHSVHDADPPYTTRNLLGNVLRWYGGVWEDARELDWARLQRRTRGHARAGRVAIRRGWIKPQQRETWRAALEPLFEAHDVLLTPTLAQVPIRAAAWDRRAWAANLIANSRYAPFAAPWNFAGYPAMAVPAGMHSKGVPLSVQLVTKPGGEGLLLSVAALLEKLRPWPRHAPIAQA
jgi:amidase